MSHHRPCISSRLLSSGEVSHETAAAAADRVRSVLLTRNFTLADVSRATQAQFPNDSRYHVPHNFYFQLRSGLSPKFQQVLALSQLTGSPLWNWLVVFGFSLADILTAGVSISHGCSSTPYQLYSNAELQSAPIGEQSEREEVSR